MHFSSSPHGSIFPAFLPTLGQRQDPPVGGSSLRLPLCSPARWSRQTQLNRTANCHLQSEMEYQVTHRTPHTSQLTSSPEGY